MPDTLTCVRHPSVETRLLCANCGDPVCPRCAVETPVGQKCPACARQARTARARGRPRQLTKAAVAGVLAAAAVGLVLGIGLQFLFRFTGGFFTLIASGFAGYGVGRAVLWGSEGNRAAPFRYGAFVLAAVAVEVAWLLLGVAIPGGFGLLSYLAAVYGAYVVFR